MLHWQKQDQSFKKIRLKNHLKEKNTFIIYYQIVLTMKLQIILNYSGSRRERASKIDNRETGGYETK